MPSDYIVVDVNYCFAARNGRQSFFYAGNYYDLLSKSFSTRNNCQNPGCFCRTAGQ